MSGRQKSCKRMPTVFNGICKQCKQQFSSGSFSNRCRYCVSTVKCNECQKSFLPVGNYYYCPICYPKVFQRNSKTCSVCQKQYLPVDYPHHVYAADPNKHIKCSKCWGLELQNGILVLIREYNQNYDDDRLDIGLATCEARLMRMMADDIDKVE
jgi:hypothetical protein